MKPPRPGPAEAPGPDGAPDRAGPCAVLVLSDPRAPELFPLVERHLADMLAASPPGSSHALAPAELVGPDIRFFALREAGRVLAFAALKRIAPGHGEVKSMHVLAAARGRGLGRRLLHLLVDRARAEGLERLSLETGTQPAYAAAVALYRAEGFVDCPPFGAYGPDPASLFLTRRIA